MSSDPPRAISATLVTRRSLRWELPPLLLGGALAFLWPIMVPDALGAALAGVQVLWGLGLLLFARRIAEARAPEEVTLQLGAGHVDIVGPGYRRRLVGRKLRGASASRVGTRVGIALQDGSPVLLEVARSAEGRAVLAALGVGHDGFGELLWATGKDHPLYRLRLALRLVGFALLFPCLGLLSPGFMVFAFPQYLMILGALLSARSRSPAGSYLRLFSQGIHVAWPVATVPYGAIQRVEIDATQGVQRLTLEATGAREPGIFRLNVSPNDGLFRPEELEHMTAQVRDAARRARGEGAERAEVGFQVADLGRGNAEVRTWLERIDRLAHGMFHGGEGAYRGRELDREELWAAIEDPDAPTDVRVAAARILGRLGPEARARILDAGKTARDPLVEKRMRIVTDPDREAEAVAEALAAIEAPRRKVRTVG